MNLRADGRRSMLGDLHGPMDHESVNGSHPGMPAVQTGNSDVQMPIRFPIVAETLCLRQRNMFETS